MQDARAGASSKSGAAARADADLDAAVEVRGAKVGHGDPGGCDRAVGSEPVPEPGRAVQAQGGVGKRAPGEANGRVVGGADDRQGDLQGPRAGETPGQVAQQCLGSGTE